MMLVGIITGAVRFVLGLLLRGATSVALIAAAARLWRRIRGCKGTYPARPFSLLMVPLWAAVAGAVLAVLYLLRLPALLPETGGFWGPMQRLPWSLIPWLIPWLCLLSAPLLGLAAGLRTGSLTHLYVTRWGRVMMRSNGRYLLLWFLAVALAAGVRLLPDGWLSTPALALLLYSTVEVLVAHMLLYLRFKHLERQCFRTVDGPRIELRLVPDEAAVVAAVAQLWAAQGGHGAISPRQVSRELRRRDRRKGDIALVASPTVGASWDRLADDPARVERVMTGLAEAPDRGLLEPGYRPGPQLDRLLRMGGMARSFTLARTRFRDDGSGVMDERHSVLAQAGGANLGLTDEDGTVALVELDAAGQLALLGGVYRPA